MTGWIFDIDGVITSLDQEKITQPAILDHLIKFLNNGEPVALNTGRSIDWVLENILNPLKKRVNNQKIFQNLFITSEFGGMHLKFSADGSSTMHKDETFKMPFPLEQKVIELIGKKYSASMRFEEKKTMITTKIKEGSRLDQYTRDQKLLAPQFKTLISDLGFNDKLIVETSTLAANIMYKDAGKRKGTKEILNWLAHKGLKIQHFVVFGDSFESDITMAQEIHEHNFLVEFVYVGAEKIQTAGFPFLIKQTTEKFDKGTLEFLETL